MNNCKVKFSLKKKTSVWLKILFFNLESYINKNRGKLRDSYKKRFETNIWRLKRNNL